MWQEHNEAVCMWYFLSSWTAWKVTGLGSEKTKKEWSVDKRDLFKQVGLVSWTVRSLSWLSMLLVSMNVRKAGKRQEERVWFVFTAGRPFVWRWKGKARGEKSSRVRWQFFLCTALSSGLTSAQERADRYSTPNTPLCNSSFIWHDLIHSALITCFYMSHCTVH